MEMNTLLTNRRAAWCASVCLAVYACAALPATAQQPTPTEDSSAEATATDALEILRDVDARREMLDRIDAQRFQPITPANEPRPSVDPATAFDGDPRLPPEVRQIQESLGGPAIDQFPALRKPQASRADIRSWADSAHRASAVQALREAASQLDMTANRLEHLELYPQADALRQQAQRLRIDARGITKPVAPTPMATPAPGPQSPWGNPMPREDAQESGSSMPRLQPNSKAGGRTFRPEPAAPPALEPVPLPEIRRDDPKPQPLLDSPTAPPEPTVEVEG